MYNVLIVDDEASVVNGLAYDIDWNEIGITETFKAYNSGQALDCIKNNRIDIVISDIRMPEMDGLELAERIRSQWPIVKVIVISGFEEFEYAQKAISCKVFRYITKPADYDEIKETVAEAIREMNNELEQIRALDEAKKQINANIPILQERYLNGWLVFGRHNPCLDNSAWVGCNLPLRISDMAFLILVRIDEWKENHISFEDGIYEIAIQNLIKDILLKGEKEILFKDTEDNQLVIIQYHTYEEFQKRSLYINGMVGNFQEVVRLTLGCVISVFWAEPTTINQLHESYIELTETVRRKFLFKSGVLMAVKEDTSPLKIRRLNALNKKPSFGLLVETLQLDKAMKRIDDIFAELSNFTSDSYDNLLEIYNMISGIIIKASYDKGSELGEWSGTDEKYFYNFELIKSVTALKRWSKSITSSFIEFIINKDDKQIHHLIEKTKSYIKSNIFRDISLSEIANHIHVHPNYISRLFSEETGTSLMDYITSLRISNARELLLKQDLKVYEIAEMVGYNSVAHFNRVFKREVGLTPKEYQSITYAVDK